MGGKGEEDSEVVSQGLKTKQTKTSCFWVGYNIQLIDPYILRKLFFFFKNSSDFHLEPLGISDAQRNPRLELYVLYNQ